MDKQYVCTERAHFMCPDMHFGISMKLNTRYDMNRTQSVLNDMADAHPFLKALISYEEGTEQLFYNITDHSQISMIVREDVTKIWDDYKEISQHAWDVFHEGLLKVFIYPEGEEITILFIVHHLLADGRGALELAQEFADCYVEGKKSTYVSEQLMTSIDDLPEKSRLSGISRILIKRANKQWLKEDKIVTYEKYCDFIKEYKKKNDVLYDTYCVDVDDVSKMKETCKQNGFTMNDLLMANMYLKAGTEKIIIAADIRKEFKGYKSGALGNYSTAMGIVCKTKTDHVIKKALEVHKQVQKHMKKMSSKMLVLACYFDIEPTLLDAAAISALGGFDSKAASFVGKGMFGFGEAKSYSITNLGSITNKNMKSVMFIPPASPAAKMTLGVVTLNGEMKACCSRNVKREAFMI